MGDDVKTAVDVLRRIHLSSDKDCMLAGLGKRAILELADRVEAIERAISFALSEGTSDPPKE